MTEQLGMFDPHTKARSSDPHTSHDAAASLTHVRDSQNAVLKFLRAYGPMTDTELVTDYHGNPRQSASGLRTRRSELAAAGLVVDTGRRTKLPSGRYGIVWRAI